MKSFNYEEMAIDKRGKMVYNTFRVVCAPFFWGLVLISTVCAETAPGRYKYRKG